MGRKGPRAKTKTVLKSVSKWAQFGSMQNLKFQTLPHKNHPIVVVIGVTTAAPEPEPADGGACAVGGYVVADDQASVGAAVADVGL